MIVDPELPQKEIETEDIKIDKLVKREQKSFSFVDIVSQKKILEKKEEK